MSETPKLDPSMITDASAATELYYAGIRKYLIGKSQTKKNTVYNMVVLTEPVRISEAIASAFYPGAALKQAAYLLGNLLDNKTDKFLFRGRIDEINSPHDYIPDPCSIEFADKPEEAAKLIAMHTIVVSTDSTANESVKVGDIVSVRLINNSLQMGELVGLNTTTATATDPSACQKISELISPEDKFSFRQLATAAMGFMSSFVSTGTGGVKGLGITNKLLEPIGITLHYTAGGTVQSSITVLKRGGLAYHYIIDRDGTITTLSEPNVVVYHDPATNNKHVGVAYANLGYQEKYAGRYGSPPIEQWYQGPDTAGKTRKWEPYTTAQINASVTLFKELKGKYPGIIGENIKQHSEVSRGGKQDGGPALKIYIAKFKRAVA